MAECELGLRQLCWSIQALALSNAGIQLFPKGVCIGDELALEFDHWYGWAKNASCGLTIAQLEAIAAIDKLLDQMSGNTSLWTDSAILNDPNWEQVRLLAKQTLVTLGWPMSPPPLERAAYDC